MWAFLVPPRGHGRCAQGPPRSSSCSSSGRSMATERCVPLRRTRARRCDAGSSPMTRVFRQCERATFYPCPRFSRCPRAPFLACPDSLSLRPRPSHRYCAPVDYYLYELVLTVLSTSRARPETVYAGRVGCWAAAAAGRRRAELASAGGLWRALVRGPRACLGRSRALGPRCAREYSMYAPSCWRRSRC